MSDEVDDFLEHYGVKGMKWGQRKKVSRKENRQMNKEAADKFYGEKAESLYKEAKKGGEKVLIKTRTTGDYADTVLTGKEFAQQLEQGRAMDVRMTEVFARQLKPNEAYTLNDQQIGAYKKQNFRKGS